MSRWNIATWVGPTRNQSSGRGGVTRGVVLHIAEGYYQGTIAWQLNPKAEVSSHFILGRGGECGQMVDTADKAWAQRAGNSEWLSIECEGFTPSNPLHRDGWERLTSQQIENAARILARAHTDYGVPLQLASGPADRGLGYHSMGGTAWGHLDCPGPDIQGQRSTIVARAQALVGAPVTSTPPYPLTFPPNYFGDINGPANSHGGARPSDRANIRAIQDRLRAQGFNPGASDGIFGPRTIAAARGFQSSRRLQVDGRVGPQTWGALFS